MATSVSYLSPAGPWPHAAAAGIRTRHGGDPAVRRPVIYSVPIAFSTAELSTADPAEAATTGGSSTPSVTSGASGGHGPEAVSPRPQRVRRAKQRSACRRAALPCWRSGDRCTSMPPGPGRACAASPNWLICSSPSRQPTQLRAAPSRRSGRSLSRAAITPGHDRWPRSPCEIRRSGVAGALSTGMFCVPVPAHRPIGTTAYRRRTRLHANAGIADTCVRRTFAGRRQGSGKSPCGVPIRTCANRLVRAPGGEAWVYALDDDRVLTNTVGDGGRKAGSSSLRPHGARIEDTGPSARGAGPYRLPEVLHVGDIRGRTYAIGTEV